MVNPAPAMLLNGVAKILAFLSDEPSRLSDHSRRAREGFVHQGQLLVVVHFVCARAAGLAAAPRPTYRSCRLQFALPLGLIKDWICSSTKYQAPIFSGSSWTQNSSAASE
jgi:hypothetical protein